MIVNIFREFSDQIKNSLMHRDKGDESIKMEEILNISYMLQRKNIFFWEGSDRMLFQ